LYSSQLRELNVDLAPDIQPRRGAEGDLDDKGELAAQMKNLSSAVGLRSLTIALPDNVGDDNDDIRSFSLEPLECMLALESLTLHNGYLLPTKQMLHIRRLSSLRMLSLGNWSDAYVKILVEERADCPPLQLHAVEGLGELNLQRAQLLIRMPTLQRVEPCSITPDALTILAHGLPDLHTLTVCVSGATAKGGWPVVRDSLAACHQLTDLTLIETPLEELAALFLALPPLVRKLDIRYCDRFLQSDAFFHCVSAGGLRQLELLEVWFIRNLSVNEFRQQAAEWQTRRRACAPWIKAVFTM
jgi:hypothetical protein